MSLAQVPISEQLLLEVLHAPQGMTIHGVVFDVLNRVLRVVVDHPDVYPDERGEVIPTLYADRLDCGHDKVTAYWGPGLVHVPAE